MNESMGMLQITKTETIKHLVTTVLAVGFPVSLFVAQFGFVRDLLTKTFQPSELSAALLLQAAVLLALLAWGILLRIRLAGRKSPRDYRCHQPYPGVTVFMEKDDNPALQFQFWYCPRCLRVDHKIGVLQCDPRGSIGTCERCKERIHWGISQHGRLG